MYETYIELFLFFLSLMIVLFSLYGVQVSEVKYYRRGLTLIGIGFAFVSIGLFINILLTNQENIQLYLTTIGYILVLLGLTLLTWFRKKLGL
ncbi:hypothetical protein [Methanonatronarchaeum thermophilum]|nr:hypothetical protein [Methanonatronarchaeum thermophilum]